MSLNEMLAFFKLYGYQGSGLFIVLFIVWNIMKSTFISKKITETFDKLVGKKPKNNINMSNIINHDIFNYIDFWVYSKVPVIKFTSEYKTIIFRKYLTIYLSKYRDDIRQYINSRVYEKMDDSELWKSVLSLINTIVYDYEKEMESMEIPDIIIEKMKEKNNPIITLIIDLTENICSSEYYNSENNLLKIYSILNILLSVLQHTITNDIAVCEELNGNLSGLSVMVDGRIVTEISH